VVGHTPQPWSSQARAWPIRWFRASRFNLVFECGEDVHAAGTAFIGARSRILLRKTELSNHHIHRRAGTLPWTATMALEQHNDTKELNRVQHPLAARGKLVDNPVTSPGTAGQVRLAPSTPRIAIVDDAVIRCPSSTAYQQVFPNKPLIEG
jgi:hypothetical protein